VGYGLALSSIPNLEIPGFDDIAKNGDPKHRADAARKISELFWLAPGDSGRRMSVQWHPERPRSAATATIRS
jgi:hypothetical protein